MANLIGWLGNSLFGDDQERKRAEENARRARELALNSKARYGALATKQGKQRLAQSTQPTRNRNIASQIFDQLNMLDNNRTASNTTPTNNFGVRRQSQDIANTFRQGFVAPYKYVGEAGGRALDYRTGSKLDEATRRLNESNARITDTYAQLRNAPYKPRHLDEALKQNAIAQSKQAGAVDSERVATEDATNTRRFVANTASIASDVLLAGTASKATIGAREALQNSAKTGLWQGAVGGFTGALGEKEVTPLSVATGTGIGASLGAVLPYAGYGVKKSIQNLPTLHANTSGHIGKKIDPLTPLNKTTKPKVEAKQITETPTTNQRTDQIYELAGIDTQKGLTKSNILYDNPVSKTYNKAVQGYGNLVTKGRNKVADTLQKGIQSENSIARGLTETPRVGFKNFGLSDTKRQILTQRSSNIESGGDAIKRLFKKLETDVNAIGPPAKTYERIYRVLEDSDYLSKVYGNGSKLKVTDLSPAERQVYDKLIEANKIRNDINLETGVISKTQHAKYADGTHSPRLYDLEVFGDENQGLRFVDTSAGKRRKDISKVSDDITKQAITDPIKASMVRLEVALRNKTNLDALASLKNQKLLLDKQPNKNFVQLTGKQYGEYEGKWLDKQIKSQFDHKEYFNSNLGQSTGDLIDTYKRTKLGAADRFFKSTKTTLSPGTNLGNINSNIFAFSTAANVNPATTAFRMAQGAKQLAKHSLDYDPNVYRAQKAGLFSGDTGAALRGVNDEALSMIKGSKNPYTLAQKAYGNTDKSFALGLFNELKARGLSDKDAVLRVHRAMQNYGNVGRGVATLADSPILGKPFARFTPELLRIAKNSALYNPVGTVTKAGGLAVGANWLSDKVGESLEERRARESEVGQTQIPNTGFVNKLASGGKYDGNVSLNFAIPKGVPVIGDSSVNIARLVGLNYPMEPGGNANQALTRQLDPTAISDALRKDAQGNTRLEAEKLISSLTLKPLGEQIANRDFMGRKITDPENRTYIEGVGEKGRKYSGSPPLKDQLRNRAKHLGSGWAPFFNEANAVYSGVKGNKDYYGKERTTTQAILRGVGVKTTRNDAEARQKRLDTKNFFEGKLEQVNGFLRNNPDLKEDYAKITSNTRTRDTNTKTRNLVGPEKWKIIASQRDNRLFNQFKKEAYDANRNNKNKNGMSPPIDPIFELKNSKRIKEVLELRSRPTGDDIEREEILRATTTWYNDLEKKERKYYKENEKYFGGVDFSNNVAKTNPRVQKYLDVPYAGDTKTSLIKQYERIKYGNEDKGVKGNPDKAKQFYKNNADQLSNDYEKYSNARLKEINAKRKIEGYSPISKKTFDNVTFGYEDDEEKVAKELYFKNKGKGYGYGYGGGRKSPPKTKAELANIKQPKGVTVKKLAQPFRTPQQKSYVVTKVKTNYLNKKLG